MAIDPNLAVAIDAVEIDKDQLAPGCQWNTECLAVPASAAGQRAASSARRILLVEFAFNAPIMRQIQLPPLRIVQVWILSIAYVTKMKAPVLIEANRLAGPRISVGPHREKR